MDANELRRCCRYLILLLSLFAHPVAHAAPQFTVRSIGVLPEDTSSIARALNDAGQVIGTSSNASSSNAFRWSAVDGIELLPLPAGSGAFAIMAAIFAAGLIFV